MRTCAGGGLADLAQSLQDPELLQALFYVRILCGARDVAQTCCTQLMHGCGSWLWCMVAAPSSDLLNVKVVPIETQEALREMQDPETLQRIRAMMEVRHRAPT